MFSFVNIIWTLSILGLSAFIIPALYYVLGPIRDIIAELFINVSRAIWNWVLLPCHEWGVFELIVWMFVSWLCTEGVRIPPERGYFWVLTGFGLAGPAFAYSTHLHPLPPSNNHRGVDIVLFLVLSLVSLSVIPMALLFQDTLLAWGTVLAIFQALGFSVSIGFGFICISFENDAAIIRVMASSAMLTVIFVSLRILKIGSAILKTFSSPVTIIGTFTLLFAELSYSSSWYRRDSYWTARQIPFFATVIAQVFIGSVFHFPGMRNIAFVFGVLFGYLKATEFYLEKRWNPYILGFLLSLSTWYAAMWLNGHPQFLVSCFRAVTEIES